MVIAQLTCLNGAAFSVTTKQAGGGEATEYFDVLGRSIQTQSKSFNGQPLLRKPSTTILVG